MRCGYILTLLEPDSSGPSAGSKATPNRAPFPKEPVLLRVDGCEGWSEMIESPSRKFSAQKQIIADNLQTFATPSSGWVGRWVWSYPS